MKAYKGYFSVFAVLLLSILTTGCPEKQEAMPDDLPTSRQVPNPDFLTGSVWVNEDNTSPLREVRIAPKNEITILVDYTAPRAYGAQVVRLPGVYEGRHRLRVAYPAEGQSVLSGYPPFVSAPIGVWFTDDPRNPSVANLALMIPSGSGTPNYLVLLGTYVNGLDTMEWIPMHPVPAANSSRMDLKPAPNTAFGTKIVFRKKVK